MITEKLVSETMFDVKVNGSYSTHKASYVSMIVEHRAAPGAADLFMEIKETKEHPKTGLIGFKLVAVYEDGEPEPEDE